MRVIGGLMKSEFNVKDNQIPIPYYMKVNLGFEPDTDIYFFIPKQKKELILTPINPFYWRYLLKINLILKEKAGVVQDILNLIMEAKAYSAISETVTTEADNKHEATVIFNLVKDYKNETVIIIDDEMERLQENIREKLKGKLHKDFDTYEHILISKLEYLPPLWESLEPERTDPKNGSTNNEKYMGKVQKGWVEIPVVYLEQLKKYFDTHKIFLFSDTEEKYIKYLFLDDSDTLYWLDIHYSRIRFLQLSFRFFEEKIINIFGSYSLPRKGPYGVYSIILQLNEYLKGKHINYKKINSEQILKALMQNLKKFIKEELDGDDQLKNEVRSGLFFRGKIYTPIVGGAGRIEYPPEEIIV